MKLIFGVSSLHALKPQKSVLMQVRRLRTYIKTDFYNEKC
ncbi:hypothetical protein APA_1886 [Pseudanabaena sp. lw0831]|nr:hypothetical protein APA_1886 [Pseudanabaena sp. lw0831]